MDTDADNKTRTILIEGMTSDACVQKVTAALKRVSGITIEAVRVGEAVIVCTYPAALSGARASILYAGYRAQPLEYGWGASKSGA
jgi:copper chaperone CopZ